jgi:hypothetical protein
VAHRSAYGTTSLVPNHLHAICVNAFLVAMRLKQPPESPEVPPGGEQ